MELGLTPGGVIKSGIISFQIYVYNKSAILDGS